MTTSNSLAALEPIMLPPLETKINNRTFTCQGGPLLYKSFAFNTSPHDKLPLTEPVRTKAGKVKVHQPHITPTKKDYWVAQCLFRRLNASGIITDLQSRIRGNTNGGMTDTSKDEQAKLITDFRIKNAAERDRMWQTKYRTDEDRANADPLRFIQERWPSRQSEASLSRPSEDFRPEAILLKTSTGMDLRQAVERSPGIFRESVDALTDRYYDRWTVIGNDKSAVHKLVGNVARQKAEMDRKCEAAKNDNYDHMHQSVIRELSSSTSSGNGWSIAGKWVIFVDDDTVLSDWAVGSRMGYLNLHKAERMDSTAQIWADFDFESVTGMMRFVKLREPNKRVGNGVSKAGTKRSHAEFQEAMHPRTEEEVDDEDEHEDEHENEDEGEGVDEDEGEGEDEDEEDEDENAPSIYEPEFAIASKWKPSPEQPAWSYRWRGEETGEGEIQLYSDEKLYTVTFAGLHGTDLTGTFGGGHFSLAHITGFKIANEGTTSNVGYVAMNEWNSRSEAAHERARVGRWH